ncbi:MAG TPA: hypothetical protein VGD97_07600 [Lacunisphaera sp.]
MDFRSLSLLLLFGLLPVGRAAELRREYAQTPEEARRELETLAAGYDTAAGWRQRAALVRQGILAGAGLAPLPARTPLNPRLTAERAHPGYVVQNLAFESLPGFFVTGTLYRPAAGTGPCAAVLLPHGHFADGNGGGRFHPDIQRLAATLARAGVVVFAYDMVGWGESTQYPHKDPGSLTLQLWNSIRSLDYLASRPDVDPSRLAITGASGGGTQAFLLAAVDDRVAVSVPVVQVSAYFFGGCDCESGLPIHTGPAGRTNNAEIAALAAPRPQLIVSDGKDWTQHTPEIGFPYIRRVYGLLGAEQAVESAHFATEGHDYGPSKQAAAVAFLVRHLRLDARNGAPEATTIETPEIMRNFSPAAPRPPEAPTGVGAIQALLRR